MSIKVIPKFLLRYIYDEDEWEEAMDDEIEHAMTLKEYTQQVYIPDDTQNALINKVKERFSELLRLEHEGETNVEYDTDSGIYKLIRPGTTQEEFTQLLDNFHGVLNSQTAPYGTGFIYLDIVPDSYNANIGGGNKKYKKYKKKRSVRIRKTKSRRKNKKTKRKY